MNEFEIIKTFFNNQILHRKDVVVGIGDDCAIIDVPSGHHIAITTDTLIAGVHFPLDTEAYDIGFKSLAVNLSDLAAMGATPAWFTLALTLPTNNALWLTNFSRGLFDLASRYQIQLIGGDTTRGPLSITIQAQGLVPKQQMLTRGTAKPGDLIYVTHTLGDAAYGLSLIKNRISVTQKSYDYFLRRLNRPEPQIIIGEQLRLFASAAIDISDGLAADVLHILESSEVGAVIDVSALPLSTPLLESIPLDQAIDFALTGGDDYEICFTAPPDKNTPTRFKSTCIGKITEVRQLIFKNKEGQLYQKPITGYKHF